MQRGADHIPSESLCGCRQCRDSEGWYVCAGGKQDYCNTNVCRLTVNFLGPQDEFVVSGSDDGNWFMWKKSTGQLHDILEGDSSVVNVIEGHPHLPIVAVSGIDTTVKVSISLSSPVSARLLNPIRVPPYASQLFAPASQSARSFSRLSNAESIISRNAEASSRRIDLASLLLQYQMVRADPDSQSCTFQ